MAAAADALRCLGLTFPPKTGVARVLIALARVRLMLSRRSIDGLRDLPALSDERIRMALTLLSQAGILTAMSDRLLFVLQVCKAVELSLSHGN